MPKISTIDTIPIKLPMAGALSWGKAGHMAAAEHVLVRLCTDTGHEGWAEAPPAPTIYGETVESVQAIVRHHLAPRLVGMAVTDFDGVNRTMSAIANNHTAKGAVDICLYEAAAAVQGQSLLEFINPPQRRIKVSFILGIADRDTMLAEARSVAERGVRVFKVKVGRNFAADVEVIRALQAEFSGEDISLYADANEGLQPETAPAQLAQLAGLGLLYVEEPLPVERISERAALRAGGTLPLIADDSAFTPRDLSRELHFNTFDILNIKTARTGYTQSRQMLAAAQQHRKGVMIGSQASSTIGTIRAAIFAGLAGVTEPSELSFTLKLQDDVVSRPLEFKDGYLHLDDLAGISIDPHKLAQLATQPTN